MHSQYNTEERSIFLFSVNESESTVGSGYLTSYTSTLTLLLARPRLA
jgi:hypothetical protein